MILFVAAELPGKDRVQEHGKQIGRRPQVFARGVANTDQFAIEDLDRPQHQAISLTGLLAGKNEVAESAVELIALHQREQLAKGLGHLGTILLPGFLSMLAGTGKAQDFVDQSAIELIAVNLQMVQKVSPQSAEVFAGFLPFVLIASTHDFL